MRHCPRGGLETRPSLGVRLGTSPPSSLSGSPSCPCHRPQQSHACSVAGVPVTHPLDVAIDVPSLPHDLMYSFCCHSCPASHPGGLPLWAPREPCGGWLGASWLTSLAVAGCTPLPPCSSLVRGPGGSGPIHLPPPWPIGAEAVASRRSLGQVLMVGLWAEASGPVLPAPVVVRPRPAGGSPVPPACALGSWWPGRTGRDGGPSRPVAIIPR